MSWITHAYQLQETVHPNRYMSVTSPAKHVNKLWMCEKLKARRGGGGSEVTLVLFQSGGEREEELTPLPFGEVRVCCWVIKMPAEHGFCTWMEVIREDQRWGGRREQIFMMHVIFPPWRSKLENRVWSFITPATPNYETLKQNLTEKNCKNTNP